MLGKGATAAVVSLLVATALPIPAGATHWASVVGISPDPAYLGETNRFTITVYNAANEILSIRMVAANFLFCYPISNQYVFREDDGTTDEVSPRGSRGFEMDIPVDAVPFSTECSVTVHVTGQTSSDPGPETVAYEALIHFVFVAPLRASVNAGPTIGIAPLLVYFVVFASGGVAPLSYKWSFGDGAVSESKEAQHTYSSSGTFSVKVLVTDARGQNVTVGQTIIVDPPSILNSPIFGLTVMGMFLGGVVVALVLIVRRGKRRTRRGL